MTQPEPPSADEARRVTALELAVRSIGVSTSAGIVVSWAQFFEKYLKTGQ